MDRSRIKGQLIIDMQKPTQEKERLKLEQALRSFTGNERFACVLSWLKSELQKRDIENRVKGFENQTSEAQALAFIVDYVAACQVPVTDRDSAGSDTGSESAATIM